MCSNEELRNEIDDLRREVIDQGARLSAKLDAVSFELRGRSDALSHEQTALRTRLDSLERSAITQDGLAESLLNAGVITSDSLGDVLWNSLRVSSMRALKAIVTIGGAIGLIVAVVSWLLRIAFGGG